MRKIRRFFQDNIAVKIIWKTIKILIEILLLIIAITIIIQRVTNNEKSFFGYRIFCVITGSMEPQYTVGDIILSKYKEPEDLRVGDTLVYIGKKDQYAGKIITHKIVEIEQDENGKYLFHTMGIANVVEDPVVEEDQVYGVVISSIKMMTWLYRIMSNKYGLYFIIILPISIFIFVSFLRSKSKEKKRELEENERERLRQEEKAKLESEMKKDNQENTDKEENQKQENSDEEEVDAQENDK